jgi:CAAX prenyl protease-like protein
MRFLRDRLKGSPALVRVLPLAVVLLFVFARKLPGADTRFWAYAAQTVAGAAVVWFIWPLASELRWKFSWEAVVAGVLVFAAWVGLDGWYPPLGQRSGDWDPFAHYGREPGWAWFFVGVRIVGTTLVVPCVEELFYRSFLYRWIENPAFLSVPLGRFASKPFFITSAVFGLVHAEWLAGILCGLTYQGLVCRKQRLGDAMTAHAITNLLLGLWVIWKGAWQFW